MVETCGYAVCMMEGEESTYHTIIREIGSLVMLHRQPVAGLAIVEKHVFSQRGMAKILASMCETRLKEAEDCELDAVSLQKTT